MFSTTDELEWCTSGLHLLKNYAEIFFILSLSVTFALPLAPFTLGGRVANCLCCVIYSGAEASRQESLLGGSTLSYSSLLRVAS